MEGRTLDRWFNTSAFVRSKCDGCSGDGLFIGRLGYGNAGPALFDAPAIKTWNESNNRAMLSINEALGFVKQPAWVNYHKTIKEEEVALTEYQDYAEELR